MNLMISCTVALLNNLHIADTPIKFYYVYYVYDNYAMNKLRKKIWTILYFRWMRKSHEKPSIEQAKEEGNN